MGEPEDLRLRPDAVRGDQQTCTELDRLALGVISVADHDHIAGGDFALAIGGVDRVHPNPPLDHLVGPLDQLAVENLDDLGHRGRSVDERRRRARLADVAVGKRALGHDTDEPLLAIDDRHDVEVLSNHRQPDRAHRLVARSDGKVLAHHIADAQEHMTEQLRDRRATALEGPLRLRVDLARGGSGRIRCLRRACSSARHSRSRPRSNPGLGVGAR